MLARRKVLKLTIAATGIALTPLVHTQDKWGATCPAKQSLFSL